MKLLIVFSQFSKITVTLLVTLIVLGFMSCKKKLGREENPVCPLNNCINSSITTSVDVHVDFTKPESVPTLTGVLHGVTSETPEEYISGIQLASARGKSASMDLLLRYGITPVLVVSDYVKLQGKHPSANWNSYETQVKELVNLHSNSVIYDLWNEPDVEYFWPWWKGFIDNNSELNYFETFKRGHDIIREILGDDAIITGPSHAILSEPKMRRFVDYCRQESLKVQILAVHILSQPDQEFDQVERQLRRIYEDYVNNPEYSEVGVTELHVGEYGGPKQYGRPGSMLALIRIMERAGVTQAMRAIWGPASQFRNDLHGLQVFTGRADPLHPDEWGPSDGALSDLLTPDFLPRGNWWAHKYYADGANSRVEASSNLEYIMPLASSASANLNNQHQVILASYNSEKFKNRLDKIGVRLKGLSLEDGAKIKLLRIPYDDTASLETVPLVCECELQPQSEDQVTFSVDTPDDYEVYVLTIEN